MRLGLGRAGQASTASIASLCARLLAVVARPHTWFWFGKRGLTGAVVGLVAAKLALMVAMVSCSSPMVTGSERVRKRHTSNSTHSSHAGSSHSLKKSAGVHKL